MIFTKKELNNICKLCDSIKDKKFKYLSEEAKKLKEELGLYRKVIGSHKSTSKRPFSSRNYSPQVQELNECINEAIENISKGIEDSRAWNRLSLKLEAWRGEEEFKNIAKKAANAIKKFENYLRK